MPTRLRAARDFERAAKISFDLARQQMQSGNANVLLLLNAQQTYLQAHASGGAGAQRRGWPTPRRCIAALGGGWWNRIEPLQERRLDVEHRRRGADP